MAKDFFSSEYKSWIAWVDKRLDADWPWEKIAMCGKDNEEELMEYLSNQDPFDYHMFSLEEWREFIAMKREDEEKSKPVIVMNHAAQVGVDDMDIPDDKNSAWQKYRKKLEGNFPGAAINQIERSSKKILNMLYDGSGDEYKIVHGLVMGNVQSGKTANMEGLMAMAADYGWNMFIILSGTIENLRQQTRSRFMRDLNEGEGNLVWDYSIDNPTDKNNPQDALDLSPNSRRRYVTVCLKHSTRLKKLLNWLNKNKHKKAQMKVLIIDDESDQASINTGKIDQDEITRINKLIKAIVNGNVKENSDSVSRYKAMNYVAYTATPYGNFLNEKGEGSLYPKDFIHVLESSDTYFGPKQIFGDTVNGTTDGMPIINPITTKDIAVDDGEEDNTDTGILESINESWKNNSDAEALPEIPASLKEAVAWFCVCIAIQRYRKYKKPVSMLVHHDMKVEYHTSIAVGIRQWFDNLPLDAFMSLCLKVYGEQTAMMSHEGFKMAYREYGKKSGIDVDQDVMDYPDFAVLREYLVELKNAMMRHITMNDNEELVYGKGIHLCVDNCKYTTIIEDDDKVPHVRLVYPQNDEYTDYAPAFLVVGGNTLARGLTLEGLVCTYFSRVVKQADTLMQMGRWFGYRSGYELLPRLWMTDSAVDKFTKLAALDEELRSDIYDRYLDNITPEECGPMISTCPGLAGMKISAANKMQGAVAAEADFAGAHLQTVVFKNDDTVLQNNIDVADAFITSLGQDDPQLNQGHENEYKVWQNVPFDRIKKDFFMKSQYDLSRMETLEMFYSWFENKADDFTDWNVILRGKKSTDKQWHGVGKVVRTRKKSGVLGETSKKFNIGVLSDPNIWQMDLQKDKITDLTDEEADMLKSPGKYDTEMVKKLKMRIREQQGKEKVPRLVLYCIDHAAKTEITENRAPLNTNVDVMGVEIIIPGKRDGKSVSAVQIKQA